MTRHVTEVRTVVRFIRMCGRLTSTWPTDPDAPKSEKIMREFLWWVSFVNVIGLLVPLILAVFHYRHELGVLMKSLSELTALSEVFFNLILCKFQRSRLQVLLSEVMNYVENAENNDRLVLQKYVNRYLPFLITVGTSYFLTAVAFSCGPLVMMSSLPADAWYPFSIEPVSIRYSLYVFQVLAILQTGLCLTVDFMVGMMLWYASARLEILGTRIKNVTNDTQLSRCVEDHQKLIVFAKETAVAVRFMILKGNATMALAVICGAFPLIHHEPLLVVSQFILMVAGGLLRLYVSAWPADDLREMVSLGMFKKIRLELVKIIFKAISEIIDKSEKLADMIYCTRWIDASPRMRKSVLFVIQRSQKPLVISVSGVLPALTLTFYASFVSSTLSYFMTLRAVIGE